MKLVFDYCYPKGLEKIEGSQQQLSLITDLMNNKTYVIRFLKCAEDYFLLLRSPKWETDASMGALVLDF